MGGIVLPQKSLKRGDQGSDVRLLHEYLSRYGYFPSETLGKRYKGWKPAISLAPASTEVFDDRTEEALRIFQRNHGLNEDGALNDETLQLMSRPRCGCPDAGFVASEGAWKKRSLTFTFGSPTPDEPRYIREIVREALDRWSAVTPLSFRQDYPDADIKLVWAAIDDGAGTLAWAELPNGTDQALTVAFDSAETWSDDDPPSGIDLLSVALHELGHSIGLQHSDDPAAVMYAYYDGARRELTTDDVDGAQSIYGVTNRVVLHLAFLDASGAPLQGVPVVLADQDDSPPAGDDVKPPKDVHTHKVTPHFIIDEEGHYTRNPDEVIREGRTDARGRVVFILSPEELQTTAGTYVTDEVIQPLGFPPPDPIVHQSESAVWEPRPDLYFRLTLPDGHEVDTRGLHSGLLVNFAQQELGTFPSPQVFRVGP